MRYYQRMTGVSGATGATLDLLPEDVALGDIPDWAILIDPSYTAGVSTDRVYNRVTNTPLVNVDAETDNARPLPMGAFANGQRAFAPATGSLLSIKSPVAINPRQHTFFSVMNHGESGNNLRHIAAPLSAHAAASPGLSPRYGVRRDVSSLRIWPRGTSDDNGPYRLNAAVAPALAGRTALLAWTFSTEKGFTARVNGVQVGANPDDRAPLTSGFGAGQWRMFSFMTGLVGMSGLINRDLSAVANARYLFSLEAFLMQKYGIST